MYRYNVPNYLSRSASAGSQTASAPSKTLLAMLRHAVTWPFKQLLNWQRHEMMRHHIALLDDHLLRDMGISRSKLKDEMERPFWRQPPV